EKIMIGIRALLIAALIGAGGTAFAQEQNQDKPNQKVVELGVGVICDRAESVQRYLALFVKDVAPSAAIEKVNLESGNRIVCAIGAVAFTEDEHVGNVDIKGGIMRIMQITIVGMRTPK